MTSVVSDQPLDVEDPVPTTRGLRWRSTWVTRVFTGLAVLVAAGYVAVFAFTSINGWTVSTMSSGSMSPQYPTGTLLLTAPASVQEFIVGDLVAYGNEYVPWTMHRVVDVRGDGSLLTQGDVSANPDAIPISDDRFVVHEVMFASMAAGHVWRLLPWLVVGLAGAVVISGLSRSRSVQVSWGFAAPVIAVMVGATLAGSIIAAEAVRAGQTEDGHPTVLVMNGGLLPARVSSVVDGAIDGDPVVLPGQMVEIRGVVPYESIDLRAVTEWDVSRWR